MWQTMQTSLGDTDCHTSNPDTSTLQITKGMHFGHSKARSSESVRRGKPRSATRHAIAVPAPLRRPAPGCQPRGATRRPPPARRRRQLPVVSPATQLAGRPQRAGAGSGSSPGSGSGSGSNRKCFLRRFSRNGRPVSKPRLKGCMFSDSLQNT